MALRGLLRLFATSALLGWALATNANASETARLLLGPPHVVAGSLVYRIEVIAPGAPAVIVLPLGTRLATLDVDGVQVERVGSDLFVGHRPLAHSGASLVLSGLHRGERVLLHVSGTRERPRLLPLDVVSATYGAGIFIGVLYGLLATVALLQIVAIIAYREWANFWYLCTLADVAVTELMRNDVWHFEPNRQLLALGYCATAAAISMVGFTASYLNLYSTARRLLWWIVGANLVPGAILRILLTAGLPLDNAAWLFVPPLVAHGSLLVVAALRWRTGFKPAALLLLGLCSLFTYYAASIALDVSHTTVPAFEWWGFEVAVALDTLAFSLGIAYRDRFAKRVQSEIERELLAATFAASHDPLTGLLNRRGLEEWVASMPQLAGTLLYLDLDGFKAVNDRGGHAAGDDTLRLVARIIAHAVRDEDRAARLGGDEFAIVLVNVRSRETVDRVIVRISDAIAALRPLGAQGDVRIGVSAGIGRLVNAGSFEDALREADGALYRQKSEHHAFARLRAAN